MTGSCRIVDRSEEIAGCSRLLRSSATSRDSSPAPIMKKPRAAQAIETHSKNPPTSSTAPRTRIATLPTNDFAVVMSGKVRRANPTFGGEGHKLLATAGRSTSARMTLATIRNRTLLWAARHPQIPLSPVSNPIGTGHALRCQKANRRRLLKPFHSGLNIWEATLGGIPRKTSISPLNFVIN